MCTRCVVYITASKLDINLRRLGKDNQKQNGPLVEKLCNILNLILQGCICLKMKSQFFPETQAGQRTIKLETKPCEDVSN